ncbi:MAG TPA: 3-oxoacyl-ACP reductase [Planctomycetaceae bacterium]|nr:3-oxoacyl-ACP reductase [Planctomycetaceae bacterium]
MQSALITGASSGIGRQIAITLAQVGYQIVVDHFRDPDGADETLSLVRRAGGDGLAFDGDVGSSEEMDKLFEMISAEAAPLGVVVNNAAIQTFASLVELTEQDFDRTIRTNLKGTFLVSQRAARLMKAHGDGGVIINIGSGANQVPFPDLVDYCCSKGGIEMLTKVSAVELGPDKIRVNCIAPGAIVNDRTRAESPNYAKTWGEIAPLRRAGTEQDIAQMVQFLVSDQASFVTGQTIFVDGGLWTKNEWPYEEDA